MDSRTVIIAVVAIYFIALLVIGFVTKGKNEEVDDFLVAGRNVGLWVGAFVLRWQPVWGDRPDSRVWVKVPLTGGEGAPRGLLGPGLPCKSGCG